MARKLKNTEWDADGLTWDGIKVSILQDIRDELHQLNRLLNCANFTNMPRTLQQIRKNTANLPKVKK